jgi:hypothetical protein
MNVFWNVAQYTLMKACQRFGGTFCRHHNQLLKSRWRLTLSSAGDELLQKTARGVTTGCNLYPSSWSLFRARAIGTVEIRCTFANSSSNAVSEVMASSCMMLLRQHPLSRRFSTCGGQALTVLCFSTLSTKLRRHLRPPLIAMQWQR